MEIYFAPLDGITGFTYRNLFEDNFGGVSKYYAPFISPTVNPQFKGKEIRDLLPENNKVCNLIPQILCNRADFFAKATKQLIGLGYKGEININMGCPSGTVTSKNKGSGFLRDLEGMDKFFDEVTSFNESLGKDKVKISVKTRIGFYDASEFEKILEIYNKYPIDELIIHPRTRVQMYKGEVNNYAFDYAYKNSKNKVVYNGNIFSASDYKKLTENYDLDAVMIGRGLIANPTLIREINGGSKLSIEDVCKYHNVLYKEFEVIMKSDKHLLNKMKEFWFYIAMNFRDEHNVKKKIRKSQNLYKYKIAVDEILENYDLK